MRHLLLSCALALAFAPGCIDTSNGGGSGDVGVDGTGGGNSTTGSGGTAPPPAGGAPGSGGDEPVGGGPGTGGDPGSGGGDGTGGDPGTGGDGTGGNGTGGDGTGGNGTGGTGGGGNGTGGNGAGGDGSGGVGPPPPDACDEPAASPLCDDACERIAECAVRERPVDICPGIPGDHPDAFTDVRCGCNLDCFDEGAEAVLRADSCREVTDTLAELSPDFDAACGADEPPPDALCDDADYSLECRDACARLVDCAYEGGLCEGLPEPDATQREAFYCGCLPNCIPPLAQAVDAAASCRAVVDLARMFSPEFRDFCDEGEFDD